MSLNDIYDNVLDSMEENKSELITLLEEHIDFDTIIPYQFYNAYYSDRGRKRVFSLKSLMCALLLKKILGISEDSLLLNILKLSKELRDYCEFSTVPNASQLTRIKQDFQSQFELLFEALVNITKPICEEINSKKSDYLIYDTTGIEPKVKENNPKFMNTKLKEAKKIAKSNPDFDPYKGVYGLLPDEALSSPSAKQQYINGHYCYAYKVGIVTDGLGIVRHISFFDDDFKAKHPEIVSKKTDNPDKDKEISDSVSLKPVLSDFFKEHPDFSFSTFLGDSAFDSYDNFSVLKNEFGFSRVCVPLNSRNSKHSSPCFNEYGNPVCPNDGVQFIFQGKCGGKNRSERFKWVCPKSIQSGNTRICTCENPCTNSSYGKCVYTYPEKSFRDCPGIPRNTEHWDNLYKHRVLVERTINLFKDSFGLASLRTHDPKTIKAELFLAGCAQLIGVILAKAIHQHKLFKSIRKIVSLTA
ncbi:MAG: ISNCY family transposase [Firmicutes bacterium]|nr:ISNCY family transposase [Bacillota bacterium]